MSDKYLDSLLRASAGPRGQSCEQTTDGLAHEKARRPAYLETPGYGYLQRIFRLSDSGTYNVPLDTTYILLQLHFFPEHARVVPTYRCAYLIYINYQSA